MSDASRIAILVNGKPQQIPGGMSVGELLHQWKVRPELVTVEVNDEILQKLDYDSTALGPGDRVEFIFYMGGGSVL